MLLAFHLFMIALISIVNAKNLNDLELILNQQLSSPSGITRSWDQGFWKESFQPRSQRLSSSQQRDPCLVLSCVSQNSESITKRLFDYTRFAMLRRIDDLSENQFLGNMWSKHLPIMIAKWNYALLRNGRWFSDVECMWVMLVKVLLRNHLLLKLGFIEAKRTITWGVDLQLTCLKANWLNSFVAFTYIARNWFA